MAGKRRETERRTRTAVLRADLAHVDKARAFLRESLRGLPVGEEDAFKIELALAEMCVNIARYAYPGRSGKIALSLEAGPDGVVLEIRDRGIPFDPRAHPVPDLERIVRSGRPGGLGIHLARRFTDGFDYRREDGENVLTLRKAFAGPAASSSS